MDKWVWMKDPSGVYSVRTAYTWIRSTEFSGAAWDFHKKLWQCGGPLKVKAFIWKLAQDRIPTNQNPIRRGVTVQKGMCKACNNEEESAEHLFFKCKLFSSLWYDCLRWWGIQAPLQGDCKSSFFQFIGLLPGSKKQVETWELVWLAIIWVIWNARNEWLFKGKETNAGEMLDQVKIKKHGYGLLQKVTISVILSPVGLRIPVRVWVLGWGFEWWQILLDILGHVDVGAFCKGGCAIM